MTTMKPLQSVQTQREKWKRIVFFRKSTCHLGSERDLHSSDSINMKLESGGILLTDGLLPQSSRIYDSHAIKIT
jgi:hypothetical protein